MPLFNRMLRIMGIASFVCGTGMVLALTTVGPWLLSKWTGGHITVSHLTLGLFALSIAFQGLWVCFQLVLSCCNRHHFFNYFYCGSVALSLVVTLFLARPFGFDVVPVIMVIGGISVAAMGFYLCTKKLNGFDPSTFLCLFQVDFYRSMIAKMGRFRRPVATP